MTQALSAAGRHGTMPRPSPFLPCEVALMKLLVRVVIVLMVLVVLVIVGTATVGWSLTRARRTAPPVHLTVAPDSSLRERGEHLVTVMCAGCHGRSYGFPLEGNGENFLQIPKGPNFGRMYPPNLT